MDLGLDVAVERISVVCFGQLDERHSGGDTEVSWLEDTVWVAERCSKQGLFSQA